MWQAQKKTLSAEGAQPGEWPACDRRISRPLLEAECGGSTLLRGEQRGSLITNFKAPMRNGNLLNHSNSIMFSHVSVICNYIISCTGNGYVSQGLNFCRNTLVDKGSE